MSDTKPEQNLLSSVSTAYGVDDSASAPAAPNAGPPAGDASGSVSTVGASTWVTGKKVNALWAINENRNSWVGVAGVGWVKLANNSDSAIMAFTILSADARQTQGIVNYRQEADGMLHELYVW